MALLFMDGFDHYATADITKKWTSTSGGAGLISAGEGRRGSAGFKNAAGTGSGHGTVGKSLAAAIATVIVGFSLELHTFGGTSGGQDFVQFMDGSTTHVSVGVTASGAFAAYRGGGASGTLLGTSAGGLVNLAVANYVEVKTTIHDSTGSVEVRLNGVTVLNLTGVDTRNGAAAQITTVRIGQFNAAGGSHCRFDDFYLCDTSGSVNNDFLGDVRVDSIYPNGDGNYSQFTPSTGTTHYTLVDETAPNTTDYVDGSNVGDRDSYTLQDLAALASQTIYGVQVNAATAKDDVGAKSASTFVRHGSANGDGATVALSSSQAYISQVYETNPNGGGAWTESSVNAMEAGVRVTA